MTPEQTHACAQQLCRACAQSAQEWVGQLLQVAPAPPESGRSIQRVLMRELGLLGRYWATQQIWQRLEADDRAATALNLAVLRAFTEAFQLPRDGSGLRYASLGSPGEESRELGARVTTALGLEHEPLLRQLQVGIAAWRQTVLRAVEDALAKGGCGGF